MLVGEFVGIDDWKVERTWVGPYMFPLGAKTFGDVGVGDRKALVGTAVRLTRGRSRSEV